MTSSAVKSQRIRAVVRVRPLLPFESSHTSDLLAVGPRLGDGRAGQNIALHPKKSVGGPDQAGKEFRVDAVFTVKSTQQEVFDGCNIKSMVAAVCKGYKYVPIVNFLASCIAAVRISLFFLFMQCYSVRVRPGA